MVLRSISGDYMIISHNTQTRHCSEIDAPVRVTIKTKLPMQRGLGGMLRPKKGGFTQVTCEFEEQCKTERRDCVWAVGAMRSKRDPIELNIPI